MVPLSQVSVLSIIEAVAIEASSVPPRYCDYTLPVGGGLRVKTIIIGRENQPPIWLPKVQGILYFTVAS